MNRHEWLAQVRAVLAEHPDWMGDTVLAMQEGVNNALNRVLEDSANVESGFLEMVTPGKVRKLTGRRLGVVRRAVEALRTVKGAPVHVELLDALGCPGCGSKGDGELGETSTGHFLVNDKSCPYDSKDITA